MKKLYFIVAVIVAAAMSSCNSKDITPSVLPGDNLIIVERFIPQTRGWEISQDTPHITAVFDIQTEKIVSYTISPELLAQAGMTAEEADAYLRAEMGIFYNDLSEAAIISTEPNLANPELGGGNIQYGPIGDLRECLGECNESFERGNGRGACKGDCWIDFAITIFEKFVNLL